MKKLVSALMMSGVLAMSSIVHADGGSFSGEHSWWNWWWSTWTKLLQSLGTPRGSGTSGGGGGVLPVSVPELSLGGLAVGLMLVVGVLVVMGGRRRRAS
jgi:hypothetical protein